MRLSSLAIMGRNKAELSSSAFIVTCIKSRLSHLARPAWDSQILGNQPVLTRNMWSRVIRPGDPVIDATCGRGKDTLSLAEMTGPDGIVYAVDIQESAIQQTQKYIDSNLPEDKKPQVVYLKQSHATFPETVLPGSVSAIVYNLGWLPGEGSDRSLVTRAESTIESLKASLELIREGGLISVTAYTKQEGGEEEEEAVLDLASDLDPTIWTVTLTQWINRNQAPCIVAIEKKIISR